MAVTQHQAQPRALIAVPVVPKLRSSPYGQALEVQFSEIHQQQYPRHSAKAPADPARQPAPRRLASRVKPRSNIPPPTFSQDLDTVDAAPPPIRRSAEPAWTAMSTQIREPSLERVQGRDYPFNRQPRRVTVDSTSSSLNPQTLADQEPPSEAGDEESTPGKDPIEEKPADDATTTDVPPAKGKRTKPSQFPIREGNHLERSIDDYKVFFPVAKLFPSPEDILRWTLGAFNRANDFYEATIPDFVRLPFAVEYEVVVSSFQFKSYL